MRCFMRNCDAFGETYNLMNKVRMDKYLDISNEDLAKAYKDDFNPSILAEVFCRNVKLWSNIVYNVKYSGMDIEDRSDSCVEALDRALKTFDSDKAVKFCTYAVTIITTAMARLYIYYSGKNRLDRPNSYEDLCDNTYFEAQNAQPENKFDLELSMSKLNDKEKKLCELIAYNPGIKDVELAQILNVHRHTVASMKRGLAGKLSFLGV